MLRLLLCCGLVGCASLLPPLPRLEAPFHREPVSSRSASCTPGHCRHDVRVGSRRFRVETETRMVSAAELRGATAVERAAAALLGWGLRQAGLTTVDEQIVVGSRTVTSDGSEWRLECAVAWLDQRERSRDETEPHRVSEGMDCVQRGADPAAASGGWRFRYGAAPDADGMAVIADAPGAARPGPDPFTPMLASHAGAGEVYRLAEEPFGMVLGVPRSGGWRVTRSDGTVVGALRLPPVFVCTGECALDLGRASEEEANALRFIAAALMVPLRR
jgi:hypothetical protein